MENNEREIEMEEEVEESAEIEPEASTESLKSALTLICDNNEPKSSMESNTGSITKCKKIKGLSTTSITTLERLKKEISILRQSITSNTKPFSSQSSNNGSFNSKRTSIESQLIVENITENEQGSESYEIGESPTPTKESNTKSPKIRAQSKTSITSLESVKKEVFQLRRSKTSNTLHLSSNDESENSGKASNENQSMIENVTENKKGSKSYEERTLSQVSQIEIGENPTLEKTKNNKKAFSPRNKILETITEDEEVADGAREHLGMDKLNLKPVQDGKKSKSYKDAASKKHNVRNSKKTKNEKGVQFPITASNRTQDVSNRKLSTLDSKKVKCCIKDVKKESQSSIASHNLNSSMISFKNEGLHQLGPSLKFSTKEVKHILDQCIKNLVDWQMKTYNSQVAPQLALNLAAEALRSVKEKHYDRYRLCVEVIIGENLMQGVHTDAQCLWDRKFDCFAKSLETKPTFFVFIVCFGVYKE